MSEAASPDRDRRGYLRHSCTAHVQQAAVRPDAGGAAAEAEAEVMDISVGGCALRVPRELQTGERFSLVLRTEFTPVIHLRCTVIWARTLGPGGSSTAGCSLEPPTDADARALKQFLDILQTLTG